MMTKARSGGNILVECLINQGVTTSFGVPGESYLDVLDALYERRNQLRLIVTRHEGGAAYMAEAYGKLTGHPGICFVTRGPGATNAAIGVHTAMQNSSPMILFVGQIGRGTRDREAFQEIDYRAFFAGVAKWVTEIDDVQRIPELVARAFAMCQSGRPGPVVVALPEDMLRDVSTVAACDAVKISSPTPSPGAIAQAVEMLGQAKKPLILVGGGGWSVQGRADLKTFAENNNLPVTVVFRSQDIMDNSSASYIGDAGVGMSQYLKSMMSGADLILALNIRFGESTTLGWTLFDVPKMKATLIHSHISDLELGKIYQPDLPMHAGPSPVVQALAGAGRIGDWRAWCAQGRTGLDDMRRSAHLVGDVDMIAVSAWLDTHLADDVIVTNGAGNFSVWPSKFLTFRSGRRLLAPQSGAMGAGLPAAIAARAVDQSRQVLCFAGDGDFQMTMAEMGTAAQEGLQPIILLLNNGMYGTIRAHQERHYPNRVSGTKIVNPDYQGLARAYGFVARRVTRTDQFEDAFLAAEHSSTGGLIEVIIDPQDITPFASLNTLSSRG